ncbi:MAG: glycosyltransferase [Candidatus Omnitrophica bacterium]|nr:glycosyltransferase [Candidatus Omnitrophota bacterium]
MTLSAQKPIVSVIIPVFNGAKYIRGAIESLIQQTYKDFEIIVVDDGSVDSTKDVLASWILDGTLQYIYQKNKGLAGARNTGIRNAKGQYLKFLDCDDLLYPEQLERQVEHLKNKSPLVISATGYELEFEDKSKILIQLFLKDNQLAQFIGGNPCPVHSLLTHREIIEKSGGFDETLLSEEDSDLWLRMLINGAIFEKIDYIGCCYRIINGAKSSNREQMFLNHCKLLEKLNSGLTPKLYQLDEKILRELYWANTSLIDKCYAVKTKPSSVIPNTIRTNCKIYKMKLGFLNRLIFNVRRYENITYKEYRKACQIDSNYPNKLMNTAWRDKDFYKRDKFRYFEIEPRCKKIKNILYLNSSAVIYGAETRLIDIIRNLDTSKFFPFVLLPHTGPLDDRLKKLGVITMHLEYGYPLAPLNRSNIIKFLRLNRDFVRLVRLHDIDVIHANLHINMSKFWLAFLILQIPLIVHMRSHFWLRAYEKFVICRAFKAIFISKFVEKEFFKKRRFNSLMFHRSGHTEILHDGIDVNCFSPQIPVGYIRKELKISPQDFLVGIIGAVDKVKGQDLLIKAANIVVPKHPNTKFVIVGDLYHAGRSNIEYRDSLLKMIKDYHLTENIIFTGFRTDIEIFMTEIDLLVQPSEHEALGTSMVEAMSCGKPVIGTDVDGIPEVIGPNEGGILLNPRTPEAFADAINFFIENPQEARKRGLQGRERVLRLFNAAENIKRIQNIYDQALKYQW